MGKTKVKTDQTKVATTRTTTISTTTDKCSLWLVIITGISILLIVITGICAKFLLDSYLASVILVALICFEVVIGIAVLTILACRRKKYATTQKVVNVNVRRNGQYHSVQPSAPKTLHGNIPIELPCLPKYA